MRGAPVGSIFAVRSAVASLLVASTALGLTGCAELKTAGAPQGGNEGGTGPGIVLGTEPGVPNDEALQVTVAEIATARSRLGARSPAGYRPWRTGIAVHGDRVYWVESGKTPGLYSAPATGCAGASCVEKHMGLTRPAAFSATATHLFVADTTVLKRFAFEGGATQSLANATEEIVNLAAGSSGAFWTEDAEASVLRTSSAGSTSKMANSNGAPVGIAIAGDRVYWAGVDMAGQLGAMQSVGVDGSGGREVSRFSNGFHVMTGNETYLFYAEGRPTSIHRVTVETGRDEVIERDALGVSDLAVDDTYLYWAEPGDGPDYRNGQVRRVAHASKTAETLAVSLPFPVAVAVSGKAVFVASAGTSDASFDDGKILKLDIR